MDAVDRLRIERDEALDLGHFLYGIPVAPGDIRAHRTVAQQAGPIGGNALVGTSRRCDGRCQPLQSDVFRRQIETRRQMRLEQQHRAMAVGDRLAVEPDLHVARALQHVDAGIGIAGVDEDFLFLLEPLVDGLPGEGDAAGQRRQVFIRRRNERPRRVGTAPVATVDIPIGGLATDRVRFAMQRGFQHRRVDR